MTPIARIGRAIWLALTLWLCSVFGAFAHALPASVLVFSQQGDRVALSISLPLEDLLIAAPELAAIQASEDQLLSRKQITGIATYFAQHVRIQQPEAQFELTLAETSLQTAYNDHVGDYDLLTLQFDLKRFGTGPLLPMTLIYDAVMHEVRNHRAEVYWQDNSTARIGLAKFGFRPVEGRQSPVVLKRP